MNYDFKYIRFVLQPTNYHNNWLTLDMRVEKQVEKYSLHIYEVIYNKKQVNQVASNTEEIRIIQAGMSFCLVKH